MKTLRRIFITMVLGAAVVAGTGYFIVNYQAEAERPAGRFHRWGGNETTVPVLASTAKTADVPVYLTGVGTTQALNTVTVRPQVDGKLISINFKEGQDVKKGDVLAKIDPTTYQAQLDQAVAKKAQDEAQLANAKRDYERYARLAATHAASEQQADTQKATVAQLQAQVEVDQAAIDSARALVGYTTITAPISGRTGIRMVDEGNIVHASDSTGIVVITQIKPISVLFSLPEQQIREVNAAFAKGPLEVDAIKSDNKTIIERGKLTVVNNQADQSTGTVKLKAEFPNAELQLWPGQFVNIRLLLKTLDHVVVVPTAAVQRGPDGTFVFVIKPDDTVTVRPVTLTQQDDVQTVIATGLEAGQRVVTTGFAQLAEGKRVSVSDGKSAAPAATSAAQPSFHRHRGSRGHRPPQESQRGTREHPPTTVGRQGPSPDRRSDGNGQPVPKLAP